MKVEATLLINPPVAVIGESFCNGGQAIEKKAGATEASPSEVQGDFALTDAQTPRDAAADWRLADLLEMEMCGVTPERGSSANPSSHDTRTRGCLA